MTRRRFIIVATLGLVASGVSTAFLVPDNDPETVYRRGRQALDRGDLDTVAAEITALRDVKGYEDQRRLLRGAYLTRTGNCEAAVEELAPLIERDGELSQQARLLAAESLYWCGRLAEAEVLLRDILEVEPDHSEAHRWLGAVYYDLGAMDYALGELQTLAQLEPDDFSPHRLLGHIHFDFERYDSAIRHYRQALTLAPPGSVQQEIVPSLAEALIARRDYGGALELLSQFSVHGHDTAGAAHVLVLLSRCYWNLGQPERARETWSRARSLAPAHGSVLFRQAVMALESGEPEEAIAPLKRLLKKKPHDYEARYRLALAYRQLGQSEHSKDQMRKMQRSKQLRKELAELNRQAIQEPRNAELREQLAEICKLLNKPELAMVWHRAAEACRRRSAFRSGNRNVRAAAQE